MTFEAPAGLLVGISKSSLQVQNKDSVLANALTRYNDAVFFNLSRFSSIHQPSTNFNPLTWFFELQQPLLFVPQPLPQKLRNTTGFLGPRIALPATVVTSRITDNRGLADTALQVLRLCGYLIAPRRSRRRSPRHIKECTAFHAWRLEQKATSPLQPALAGLVTLVPTPSGSQGSVTPLSFYVEHASLFSPPALQEGHSAESDIKCLECG